ncbi:MAG: tRNA uridine-5-carboxymethylaminomethyl(34) synthesis GTPase MnmE [Deltaproteobacteria bacterium]|nr:tRNA uridine-5-carboxymethylaminomethyl(34) synthesis GTPase MnmE [Deltaproteobacteria bacterium]
MTPRTLRTRDTIAQVATAVGPGGVGIVRVSGPRAHAVGRALVGLAAAPPERMMLLRAARDAEGEVIDRGLYVEFVGPRSFTGEDVAELQVHGGSVGSSRLLARCRELGARAAEPGEFTLRAFENGKIDLARAEAIALAVSAETEAAHRAAQQLLAGALSSRIAEIRAPLVDAATALNVEIEFPDEGLAGLDRGQVVARLSDAAAAVRVLLSGFRGGRLLNEGATVAIVGPPNAGKSRLLNALIGYERAIVSEIAGTTRDTVEERVVLGGVAVRFVDTAGLRASEDRIEQQGIARARAAAARADLVIVVLSADTDWKAFAAEALGERVLYAWNKCDLAEVPGAFGDVFGVGEVFAVCAADGRGVLALQTAVSERLFGGVGESLPLVTLQRHADLLVETEAALRAAEAALVSGASEEVALVDVGIALHRLGALVGENVGEEVYREIFRRFCIGK